MSGLAGLGIDETLNLDKLIGGKQDDFDISNIDMNEIKEVVKDLDLDDTTKDLEFSDAKEKDILSGVSTIQHNNQDRVTDSFKQAKDVISEAENLVKENTIDSLLRYFQTGIIDDTHLPSVILGKRKDVERMLADRLRDVIKELGFRWNNMELKRNGKLVLEYVMGEYTLEFATIDPHKRSVIFHFDFTEMEREREIELFKMKHQVRETMERFKDTRNYLDDNKGLKRLRNKKMVSRLEDNIKRIGNQITEMEEEVKEINQHKILLESIKEKVPDMEYSLRKYGFIFEYVKGEQYEV